MKDKNKLIVLVSGIVVILLMVVSISFAIFRFGETSTNLELVLGDIWMRYDESNGISLENALPGEEYTNYFEFTITGTNTYTKKDIWYDISLTKGDIPTGKVESNRIGDKYLKFRLIEIIDGVETEIFTDKTYDDLTNKRIHVDTISKSTNEYSKTYRLYMTISEELTYGNSSDSILTTEEFGSIFGSVKVNVTGDFNKKEIQMDLNAAGTIKENVVSYSVASASDFTGGLVGINTNGTLYNETASEEVREYRYSGPTVNNYAYFNCKDTDGTYNYGDDNYDYTNNCETWRIVGTFKNANGEWNLKLMRNTMLTADEIPESYEINGRSYIVAYSETSQYVAWNYAVGGESSTNYNDWTTAGLQYFLNTESDINGTTGYYSTLSSKTKELIDEEYTYYLGNFVYDTDTAITGYQTERNATKIWERNQPTWNGAVGLLYPSDYGYSALSSNWNKEIYNYDGGGAKTSWIQQTANHTANEYLLSPSNYLYTTATYWHLRGYVNYDYVDLTGKNYGVRPVLNLKANTKILKGDGTEELPYVLIAG